MDKAKSLSTPMVGRSLNVDTDPFRPCEEDEDVLGLELICYQDSVHLLQKDIGIESSTYSDTFEEQLTWVYFTQTIHSVGYTDAGYLSYPHKARSQTGYVFLNEGTTISWRSQKQTLVATSSNHAEVIALHEASREYVWLSSMTQLIMTSYGLKKEKSLTLIHEDNEACVTQMKEGYIKSDRMKHKPPRYFAYTQDLIKDNQIEMKYVQSSNNLADLFTKAHPTLVFKKHVYTIDMRHVHNT
nr:retrovirus-related Pol polyprotein from transposon TNT 1-94 [Tanacetum cinerariifolium]